MDFVKGYEIRCQTFFAIVISWRSISIPAEYHHLAKWRETGTRQNKKQHGSHPAGTSCLILLVFLCASHRLYFLQQRMPAWWLFQIHSQFKSFNFVLLGLFQTQMRKENNKRKPRKYSRIDWWLTITTNNKPQSLHSWPIALFLFCFVFCGNWILFCLEEPSSPVWQAFDPDRCRKLCSNPAISLVEHSWEFVILWFILENATVTPTTTTAVRQRSHTQYNQCERGRERERENTGNTVQHRSGQTLAFHLFSDLWLIPLDGLPPIASSQVLCVCLGQPTAQHTVRR